MVSLTDTSITIWSFTQHTRLVRHDLVESTDDIGILPPIRGPESFAQESRPFIAMQEAVDISECTSGIGHLEFHWDRLVDRCCSAQSLQRHHSRSPAPNAAKILCFDFSRFFRGVMTPTGGDAQVNELNMSCVPAASSLDSSLGIDIDNDYLARHSHHISAFRRDTLTFSSPTPMPLTMI